MSLLSERVFGLINVLGSHPNLPEPVTVEVRTDGLTGVRMDMDTIDDVIAWSTHFGTPLFFHESSIAVRAYTTVLGDDGVFVEAGHRMAPMDGFRLLKEWGYEIQSGQDVQIPAGHAFALNKQA